MYKVKVLMLWEDEAQARIWCAENFILFRLEDSDSTYEETRDIDKKYLLHIKISVDGSPLDRVFCFKHEEDAVLFKLAWV